MSELLGWIRQSFAYIIALAGIAALCVVAMRFLA